MTDTTPLHFEALVRRPETRSLAYWIGLLRPAFFTMEISAEAVAGTMEYQYELEDQAGRTGDLFPEDASWRGFFDPIAPVQLTEAWSPLPDAVARLGAPAVQRCGADEYEAEDGNVAAVLAWTADQVELVRPAPRADPAERDRARFAGLLTIAAARAREKARGVVICAKPGWSHEHDVTFDARTEAIMRKAGFVVTDRRKPAARSPG